MRPSLALRGGGGGGGPVGKYGTYYTGVWGAMGSPKQKGVISFGLSANRQNAFAGAMHDAVFNTWRRFSGQLLYIGPPLIAGYFIMDWAVKRNHHLYSKEGRAELEEE
jgi:ubiquinol-cytochrome c reductase subunit 8